MARLLTVHAHPDDEASKGAPTMAKLIEDGHEAVLVCATGGEEGDIVRAELDRPEIRDNLAAVRAKELEASVDAIGFQELIWLGYRDSGMADTDPNSHPDCFAAADLDEATGRLVEIIRRTRPHVLMTYSDNQQGYLHPDHLRVHDISVLAYERAGDPDWYPELGDPWQPSKLYYSMWSRARMLAYHEKFKEIGAESPYDDRWFKRESLDDRITTRIDISGFQHIRTQALLAHATQVDPDEKFWFGLSEEDSVAAYPFEDFILAHSHVESELPESDLFAGVLESQVAQ